MRTRAACTRLVCTAKRPHNAVLLYMSPRNWAKRAEYQEICTRKPAWGGFYLYIRDMYSECLQKTGAEKAPVPVHGCENLLREQLHDVQDDLRRGLHALQRDELHLAVEVQSAGEDVRAGEALEGEVRAVGAAADRLDLHRYPGHFHRLHGLFHHEIVRFHLLAHVVVLVAQVQHGGAGPVLRIDEIDAIGHELLLRLELRAVVVPDNVGDVRLLHRAVEGNQVEESLVPLRVFRALVHGQQTAEFVWILADAALKFSNSSSPISPPSIVYA